MRPPRLSPLRIEEALDAANGIHGIVVVDEPKIWMANLYDKTGRLIIDPGPTYFAKAPIVGTDLNDPALFTPPAGIHYASP